MRQVTGIYVTVLAIFSDVLLLVIRSENPRSSPCVARHFTPLREACSAVLVRELRLLVPANESQSDVDIAGT